MSRRRVVLLVLVGAIALTASYPPFPLPPLSFFAITPAVLLIRQAVFDNDARQAFRWGWWYGLVTNALVLYWILVALWHFTPLSALGYFATIAVLGLLTAVMFWFVVRVRLAAPRVPLWVVLPVAWTALEWLVGHLGDVRFPWLGLGTSLADAPILVQWADIAGARGVTLWLAWCNVAIVEAFLGIRATGNGIRGPLLRFGAPLLASILVALGYGAWRVKTLPVRDVGVVAMVQPNEAFSEKWNPAHADSAMNALFSLSRGLMARPPRPQLLIWPEAAIPGFFVDHPQWDAQIAALVRENHVPLLTGGLNAEPETAGGYRIYNASFFYDSTGDRSRYPIYAKHYLVPVTERVPFVPVSLFRAIPGLARWSGGFRPGRELPIYASPIGKFGVVICYESAFEDAAREYRAHGADFFVNVTNDAWFGNTSAPAQHASHLVLRTIETRMGVARAANSGISEFVDPLGRSYAATKLNEAASVAGVLRTSDVIPLYVRLGDWVGKLVVVLTLGGIGLLVKRRFQP
ncbi:MAG TPA: apolipoprotein N-acyltransferase [Gemmatimonadales bacterium]|nr:apolipoprotein N-acyltransferase [Gemmatimonadales bacterium]